MSVLWDSCFVNPGVRFLVTYYHKEQKIRGRHLDRFASFFFNEIFPSIPSWDKCRVLHWACYQILWSSIWLIVIFLVLLKFPYCSHLLFFSPAIMYNLSAFSPSSCPGLTHLILFSDARKDAVGLPYAVKRCRYHKHQLPWLAVSLLIHPATLVESLLFLLFCDLIWFPQGILYAWIFSAPKADNILGILVDSWLKV